MSSLTRTSEISFTLRLKDWYIKYEDLLAEKTISSTTNKLQYTHPRLRSAYARPKGQIPLGYKSLVTNLPYLFTYKNKEYKHLKIQNTTNSIEGGIFSHMKNKISLHRGITKGKKLTFVDFYLMNLGKK